jgi:hypothetical protein
MFKIKDWFKLNTIYRLHVMTSKKPIQGRVWPVATELTSYMSHYHSYSFGLSRIERRRVAFPSLARYILCLCFYWDPPPQLLYWSYVPSWSYRVQYHLAAVCPLQIKNSLRWISPSASLFLWICGCVTPLYPVLVDRWLSHPALVCSCG